MYDAFRYIDFRVESVFQTGKSRHVTTLTPHEPQATETGA
jgi:hypothetical protein